MSLIGRESPGESPLVTHPAPMLLFLEASRALKFIDLLQNGGSGHELGRTTRLGALPLRSKDIMRRPTIRLLPLIHIAMMMMMMIMMMMMMMMMIVMMRKAFKRME